MGSSTKIEQVSLSLWPKLSSSQHLTGSKGVIVGPNFWTTSNIDYVLSSKIIHNYLFHELMSITRSWWVLFGVILLKFTCGFTCAYLFANNKKITTANDWKIFIWVIRFSFINKNQFFFLLNYKFDIYENLV